MPQRKDESRAPVPHLIPSDCLKWHPLHIHCSSRNETVKKFTFVTRSWWGQCIHKFVPFHRTEDGNFQCPRMQAISAGETSKEANLRKISHDIQEGHAFSIRYANFSKVLMLQLSFHFQSITRDSHALVDMKLADFAAILSCS